MPDGELCLSVYAGQSSAGALDKINSFHVRTAEKKTGSALTKRDRNGRERLLDKELASCGDEDTTLWLDDTLSSKVVADVG